MTAIFRAAGAITQPVGNVNTSTSPPTVAAPAGLAVGDLLLVVAWFAQGTGGGSSTIFTPTGMTKLSSDGTSTNRAGAIFAAIVTNPSDWSAGISIKCGSTSTRVVGFAVAYRPSSGKALDLAHVSCSGPTWSAVAATSATFPTGVTADLLLGIAMSNKSASTSYTAVTASSGTLRAQGTALAGASGSQADSAAALVEAGSGVAYVAQGAPGTSVSQANTQVYTVGITEITASNAAPSAAFTHTETDLTTSVDGTGSADSDGTIASYDWDWGDSTTHGFGSTASHTYRDAGTYTVLLTVTDNASATGTVSHTVTVARPPKVRVGTAGGGSVEASRLFVGNHEAVAIYVGSTLIRRFSHTIEELQADSVFYGAQRGWGNTFPEGTMYAYDQVFAWGQKMIEVSVWKSADGTFWCSHDQNLNRETGHNVDITTVSDATLATYSVLGSSASENPGQSSQPMVKLADVLAKYGTRQVIFIEDKSGTQGTALAAVISAIPDYQHRFVWKQPATRNPDTAAASIGVKTWGFLFDSEMTNFAGQQSKFDFIGLDTSSSDSTLSTAIATAGATRTLIHTAQSAANVSRAVGLGVKGVMSLTRSGVPTNAVL